MGMTYAISVIMIGLLKVDYSKIMFQSSVKNNHISLIEIKHNFNSFIGGIYNSEIGFKINTAFDTYLWYLHYCI